MKRIILFLFTVSLMSCGVSKTVKESKKVIKGNWVLSSIDYSQAGTYNVTLLNDASKACFEYSKWQFIPNNSTGTYTLTNGSCSDEVRHFIFTIQEIDESTGLYDFLLKPTNPKGKSETNQGFRFKLAALSDVAMQWQQTVSLNGTPFVITMNFTKQ
ncbi:lipocalin [Oceanihabitans sp. IOP_32]|uniref:lipocalin family protein n=1 Tax=Oceanihabitans sp. IOP_32 TaxID=2529032 RepID=UPI001293517E|nr:lipocalin family protein [Oceanihabitans sp. IOP_32]QFZ54154.1 lipocalin [Oceanihabitans sp. IOP_32]